MCLGSDELTPWDVDRDSIVIREIAPWEATYWKVLPRGYEATFDCADTPRTWPPLPMGGEWLRRCWCEWH